MSRTVLKEMKINIYVLGVTRWGRSPLPRVKDPNLLRVDMVTGGESPSKMSERCAASDGVIPKIRGPQMHNTQNLIKSNEHWGLSNGLEVLKTKSFHFEKGKRGHWMKHK